MLRDEPDRVQSRGVGDGSRGRGNVGLDRVRQRIHARRRSQPFGHPQHQQGVVHGDGGGASSVDNRHLDVALHVGDDSETSHLGGSARGGVDSDERGDVLCELVDALVVADVPAVGGHDRDALGRVVRGAAAEADDEVALLFLVNVDPGVDLLDRRVRLDAVVDDGGDPERGQELL